MVDYSKWKDIEISDDEDDTHPNIDTPSLFRWRHQARVERMEEREKEKKEHERQKQETLRKLKETKEKVQELEKTNKDSPDFETMKKALQELEKQEAEIKKKEEELKQKEKLTPWNVDTIAQPGFSKTIVNTKAPRKDESNLPDEERERLMKEFVKANEKQIKEFGMLRRFEDSKKYLTDHPHLVCENTANYLVIWCINLEMEKKCDLMKHVAHQCICMQYILELSKQLDVDPRACIGSFFSRIVVAEVEYKRAFEDELKSFITRIQKRAAEKLEEAEREAEEEERKARLGPGGLDPVEVFESLPEPLQKCFEVQDIPMLQKTIAAMPEEEARYHMKRCVASGLWLPEADQKDSNDDDNSADTTVEEIDTKSDGEEKA
ncbi:hsp90 co-chaperone Cdc37 [Trichogramma pretiosum]|uniref:hsp90 co-chaperone Cdc37 n=1 Tax=Trichogramma pretiosum TaxID=7493 RepID=UPI0006C9A045|nr:hsp90 co-chaperone Cdc37 [Trichogramma pretiosum]